MVYQKLWFATINFGIVFEGDENEKTIEGDENPHSGVVAEIMKLLGNISYGYHFMDRSRHTITNCLGDEKTHKAINGKFFKQLHVVKKDLYEVELIKSTIEHREQIYIDVCEKWLIKNYGLPLSVLEVKWLRLCLSIERSDVRGPP